VRVREIGEGKGFRIYQVRSEGNRHLADVRFISEKPETETIENLQVLAPLDLIVSKVISYHSRKGNPKSGTDWRDIGVLLIRFPELKEKVEKTLKAKNADKAILTTWEQISKLDFRIENNDEDLNF
jgi:hypothetical protein